MKIRPALNAALALTLALAFLAPAFPALAERPVVFSPEVSGSASLELRRFPDGSTAERVSESASYAFEPQLTWTWAEGLRTVRISPFVRLDPEDNERSHFDLRELYWQRIGNRWDVSAGLKKVTWGVTESQHFVNIVNQTDLAEDIDGEEKLGQPMVEVGLRRPWGHLELFLLPLFRERTFPEAGHRLQPGWTGLDPARYESGAEEHHLDVALRWSRVVGAFDLGAALFRGTDRTPRFVPNPQVPGRAAPFYRQIERLSLDLQATFGPWLWKLEALTESDRDGTGSAAIGGFEVSLFDIFGNGSDLSFLAEASRDERPATAREKLFAGVRLAVNDVAGTTALFGALVDAHGGGTFWNFESSSRLSGRVRLSLEVRAFAGVGGADPFYPIREDDYVQIEISRFF